MEGVFLLMMGIATVLVIAAVKLEKEGGRIKKEKVPVMRNYKR
jgi:hypothetical protein